MDGFTHFGTRHIKELREDTVQLLPSGMAYPIFRAESRERFEQLLKNDLRNGSITESLSADPEKADQDLREVLTSGLFTWQDKEYISRWLRDGEGNTKIAKRLSELYSGRVETMDLVTGDIADYRTFTTSIEVEIRKAHENDMESAPDTTPADELIREVQKAMQSPGDRVQQFTEIFCKAFQLKYKRLSQEERSLLKKLFKKSPLIKQSGMNFRRRPWK